MTYPKFWSDDFDMDLPKILPNLDIILGDAARIRMWTWGHISHGRLNHPALWNSNKEMTGFFGFTPETTGKPDSYYTESGLVECTWREVVRDAWVHHFTVQIDGAGVWKTEQFAHGFLGLMHHLRGHAAMHPGVIEVFKGQVARSLHHATKLVTRMHAEKLPLHSYAYFPQRIPKDHPLHELDVRMFSHPGKIAEISDDGRWAMVQFPQGQFGCTVAELRPADPPDIRRTVTDNPSMRGEA